jgi:four helix bundle protein
MSTDDESPVDFRQRAFAFAVRIVRMVRALPRDSVARELGRQVLRSGTSVGANVRAAKRGRSAAEFAAKLGIVEEECDETMFWIELLVATETVPEKRVSALLTEAEEILRITVASIKTSRRNQRA